MSVNPPKPLGAFAQKLVVFCAGGSAAPAGATPSVPSASAHTSVADAPRATCFFIDFQRIGNRHPL
jgi:hypothetical protein